MCLGMSGLYSNEVMKYASVLLAPQGGVSGSYTTGGRSGSNNVGSLHLLLEDAREDV